MKDTGKQLLVGLLLLGAGLVSPSNGVDDKVDRAPLTMLVETILIVLATTTLFFIYKKIFSVKIKR